MQLNIQTSDTTKMIPIDNFHCLCDIARCSKCSAFILKNNILYGFNSDCSAIHEIYVPFITNTDLMFILPSQDILSKYKSFFIPEKYNWVILPDYYWDMYVGGDLDCVYDYNKHIYTIIDKTTKLEIEQIYMNNARPVDDFYGIKVFKQLEGYFNAIRTLGEPHYFTNLEENEVIKYIIGSKSIAGASLVNLTNDQNVNVKFYFFKGLVSLAKSDKLDLEIRFDILQPNLFMATYLPVKKTNPARLKPYGVTFSEKIHCMYMDLPN